MEVKSRTWPRLAALLRKPVTVILCVVVLVLLGPRCYVVLTAQEYNSFSSPDGRFKIVVFRAPQLLAMPGDSGGAPGYVCLREARTGKSLRREFIGMVGRIDEEGITWTTTNVEINSVGDWNLPRERLAP